MNEEQFIIFSLGEEEFAIPISDVKEIMFYRTPTRIPCDIKEFEGVVNLRGKLLPIVNLVEKINLKSGKHNDKKIIIIDTGEKTVGFTVDNVKEVLKLNKYDIEVPAKEVLGDNDYMKGIIKLEKRIIILIDLKSLV